MPRLLILISLFVSCLAQGYGQSKPAHAVKIVSPPHLDGYLDEPVWKSAPDISGFITSSPVFGNISSDSTSVKVVYDNTSVYIGAYLYGDPSGIRKQFTPRDQERQADVDFFGVFIDSYHDRQNAYQFLVTARNVQTDARLSSNIVPAGGIYGDLSWDAVWG